MKPNADSQLFCLKSLTRTWTGSVQGAVATWSPWESKIIAGGVAADSGGVYVAGSTIGVFPPLAKQHLGAFITAVETLASQGGLPSTEAKLLVAAANDVMAQL